MMLFEYLKRYEFEALVNILKSRGILFETGNHGIQMPFIPGYYKIELKQEINEKLFYEIKIEFDNIANETKRMDGLACSFCPKCDSEKIQTLKTDTTNKMNLTFAEDNRKYKCLECGHVFIK